MLKVRRGGIRFYQCGCCAGGGFLEQAVQAKTNAEHELSGEEIGAVVDAREKGEGRLWKGRMG